MHEKIPSFTELCELWETHQALADDMCVPKSRARQWRVRNYIRPKYWPRFIDMLEQRHGRVVTARQLMLASAGYSDEAESRKTEPDTAEAA